MNSNSSDLEWTGERYVPQIRGTIALEHLHRYAFACEHVKGRDVLDIASGEGYGSEMLSRTAKHVYGVDIDEASVKHAKQKYTADNLEYRIGSCTEIPLPDASVDIVVSFETIEHIKDHEKMIQEVKRVLRLGGVFIISSPEKNEYSEVSGNKNSFHLRELNQDEFKTLIKKHFKYSSYLGQRVLYGSSLFGIKGDISVAKTYEFSSLPDNIQAQKGISRPIYIVAICSDQKLEMVTGSLCEQYIWESDFYAEQIQKNRLLSQECDNLVHNISEKDSVIVSLNGEVAFRNSQNQELLVQVSEKEGVIAEKEGVIAEKVKIIQELENQLLEKKEAFAGLNKEFNKLRESKSWKVTQPLRITGHRLRLAIKSLRRYHTALFIIWTHRKTGIFDREWYLLRYPDVRKSGMNPLWHFLMHGVYEGRAPHGLFTEENYKFLNPDISGSGVLHYIIHGWNENRNIQILFDKDFYLEQNKDVKKAGVNPVIHYLKHGSKEGRRPHRYVDQNFYMDSNKDIKECGVEPLSHYLHWGWKEGRRIMSLFDTVYYLNHNNDIRDLGVEPLTHYIIAGGCEGRDPNNIFNTKKAVQVAPEIKLKKAPPLFYYINGKWESDPSPSMTLYLSMSES
jgi:SAM-dependent methyltransferase